MTAAATPVRFAVALGSNLGDRRAHLEAAVAALSGLAGLDVEAVSSWHETAPVGGPPGQGPYLNGALVGRTSLGARALLDVLLAVELARGRVRVAGARDLPRTLDLDLLVHGDLVTVSPVLTVPHPRLAERAFVLVPLAEVAPELPVPPTGATVAALLAALRARAPAEGALS